VSALDQKSRQLLNALQEGLALDPRPFQVLGQKCGLSEDEVLARASRFKDEGTVRELSAIFDTRALGYKSCLAACKVPPERMDEAAAVLNLHPGVTHNYARNSPFNLWFTLGVPPGSDLAAHAQALHKLSGAESIRLLPALRVFKIGMKLDMTEGETEPLTLPSPPRGEGKGPLSLPQTPAPPLPQRGKEKEPLTEQDMRCVRALQRDMPLQPEPFVSIAQQAGLTAAELFDWCRENMSNGRLRRIAAVLRHRAAGFQGNGMGIWSVPPERLEELGLFFAAQKAVTHCYQRPQYPDWPYNLFTMVHARTVAECAAQIAGLARQAGIAQYAVLYSHKEYKKTRLRYFTGDIEAWERAQGLKSSRLGQ